MNVGNLFGARSVASPHHRKIQSRGDPVEIVALVARLASVGLLTGVGWVHLHLWQIGYQDIPTIGPLFLVATIAALFFAAALLIWPSRLLGLMGIGLVLGILAGLIVSVNGGLFGFSDSLGAPFAVESLVVESAAAVTLATWVGLDKVQDSRSSWRRLEVGGSYLGKGDGRVTTFIRRPHAHVQN